MQSIQEVFDKMQEAKKELKEIRKEYRDGLLHSSEYEDISEQQKNLRDKKKQVESLVQSQMGSRYERLEELKNQMEELSQMISDIAMTTIMKGESISLKDEYENAYEPVYKVSFKKIR